MLQMKLSSPESELGSISPRTVQPSWNTLLKASFLVPVQVVKELCKYTQHFRILALTATPGSDTKVSGAQYRGFHCCMLSVRIGTWIFHFNCVTTPGDCAGSVADNSVEALMLLWR